MKRSLLLPALVGFLGSLSASGQTPRPHSLSLDATATAAGGSTQLSQSKGGSKGSSSSRSTTQTLTTSSKEAIQISVRNLGTLPDTAHVEWYFIAAPVVNVPGKSLAEQQFAFDQGSRDINLAPGGTQVIPVESEEITSKTQRRGGSARMSASRRPSRASGASAPKQSGNKLSGWVVRVVADGKVIATKASSQSLEEVARNNDQLAELISK